MLAPAHSRGMLGGGSGVTSATRSCGGFGQATLGLLGAPWRTTLVFERSRGWRREQRTTAIAQVCAVGGA